MIEIKKWLCICLSIVVLLGGCGISDAWPKLRKSNNTVSIQPVDYIEIADTEKERQQGLMYRDEWPERYLMIFVYPQSQLSAFWMKDTHVSLDIVFVNAAGYITAIHPHTSPNNNHLTYHSKKPVKYVLEMKAGMAAQYGLKENQRIANLQSLIRRGIDYVWIWQSPNEKRPCKCLEQKIEIPNVKCCGE